MKAVLLRNFTLENTIQFEDILFKLFVALGISLILYITYYYSSQKVSYSTTFNLSLIAMSMITTAIMTVISSNIALSLGMVGALSIIRFRTAVKDPKNAMFIFWSIMIGICCGVSQYAIALATTAVLAVGFFCMRFVKENQKYILIIRCNRESIEEVQAITYRSFPNSRITVQNTTKESAELIYELKRLASSQSVLYLEEIYACEGVECANFVLQADMTNV